MDIIPIYSLIIAVISLIVTVIGVILPVWLMFFKEKNSNQTDHVTVECLPKDDPFRNTNPYMYYIIFHILLTEKFKYNICPLFSQVEMQIKYCG